ncbi:hypothetical protein [Haloferax sp. KTX1]|uniref:hypothetical protein n=1 Tax=Haloferax sp. KTX1 TaxID=2600597 RepID=UPI0011DE1A97|nr:hypothetical protein [Haloferax sp. KTX1]
MNADIPAIIYQQLTAPFRPSGRNATLNGVRVESKTIWTDEVLPDAVTKFVVNDEPAYEYQYVRGLSDVCSAGSEVTLIGGGEGVSTVSAAEMVGPDGFVTTYEGGEDQVRAGRRTLQLNDVQNAQIRHAVVGDDVSLRSNKGNADVVPVSDVAESDVLGIDADGAEFSILRSLAGIGQPPERLVVEHHAVRNDGEVVVEFDRDEVVSLLETAGYEVTKEYCDARGANYGKDAEIILVCEHNTV